MQNLRLVHMIAAAALLGVLPLSAQQKRISPH